jgi:hypothetical protein
VPPVTSCTTVPRPRSTCDRAERIDELDIGRRSGDPDISMDGRTIVFAADDDLYISTRSCR